jgi:isopentenyl-diphosphate delta-isomerase
MIQPKIQHPEEKVVIVDDQDRVIGEETRKRVHRNEILHREAAVFIVNPKGEILLQERVDNGKIDSSVAGHVTPGHDYQDTIIKEMEEEVGLKVDPSRLIEIDKIKVVQPLDEDNISNIRFLKFYIFKADVKIEDLEVDPSEVNSIRYYSVSEIKNIMENQKEKIIGGLWALLELYFKKFNL